MVHFEGVIYLIWQEILTYIREKLLWKLLEILIDILGILCIITLSVFQFFFEITYWLSVQGFPMADAYLSTRAHAIFSIKRGNAKDAMNLAGETHGQK